MQKAPTIFFLWWYSFKVSCSLSWEQQALLAPCLAHVPGNDDLGKEFFFLSTLKVLYLKEAQIALFNT